MKKAYGNEKFDLYTILKQMQISSVGELWQASSAAYPTLEFEEFRHQLDTLKSRGALTTEEPVIRTYSAYVRSWRFGFRVWVTGISIVVALFVVELLQLGFPWVAINWVAGSFLILVAPGFTFTWALFPSRGQLRQLSRLAISIAMSLFLVPTSALLLNYTPLGIRARPVGAVLGLLSLIFLFVGSQREFTEIARRTAPSVHFGETSL